MCYFYNAVRIKALLEHKHGGLSKNACTMRNIWISFDFLVCSTWLVKTTFISCCWHASLTTRCYIIPMISAFTPFLELFYKSTWLQRHVHIEIHQVTQYIYRNNEKSHDHNGKGKTTLYHRSPADFLADPWILYQRITWWVKWKSHFGMSKEVM